MSDVERPTPDWGLWAAAGVERQITDAIKDTFGHTFEMENEVAISDEAVERNITVGPINHDWGRDLVTGYWILVSTAKVIGVPL